MNIQELRFPPPPGREIKTFAGPKRRNGVSKRRNGVSGGVSEGSRPTPPKRVKNESHGDSASQKSSVFLTPEPRF